MIKLKRSKKKNIDLTETSTEAKNVQIDKPTVKKNEVPTKQRFIEFDIDEERKKEDDDFEALYPVTSKQRNNKATNGFDGDYGSISDEEIENLENIPAYLRKNLRMNDPKLKKEFSNLSVTSENKISDKNSYLHGQAD